MPLATIEEAVEEFRRGNFVIIIDDKDRENEGDLCIPAEKITPEKVNFMAKYGRGLICTPLTGQRLDELRIPLMVSNNNTMYGTAFTVSVESRHGVASGISASDRAKTVKVLVDPNTTPSDLIMPGHTFPLRACDGGVLVRAGHTEASIDLAKLADLYPGAVVCEIMDEDGKMMRLPQLEEFAARHGIKIISIASLIEYRYRTETIARRVARSRIPDGLWGVYGTGLREHRGLARRDRSRGRALSRPKNRCWCASIRNAPQATRSDPYAAIAVCNCASP